MADGRTIDADIVIVAIGVRPRDELFRAANGAVQDGTGQDATGQLFEFGPRGGVVISDGCETQVPGIWAIGEVANFGGMCLGLVAPANTMAEIVADRLHDGEATFPGFDTATKLKLSGVDVASFGDAFARTEHSLEIVYADPARGVYLTAAGGDAPETELPDDAILCSCNNVAAGSIRDASNGCRSCDGDAPGQELGELKGCTRAGTQCGSCVPMLKKLLEGELTKSGVAVSKALCEPAHAQLLAQDLDEETLLRYIDRYLMYYIRTADRLQRTARWQEDLDGGLKHVEDVVVRDSLGIAAELEAAMAKHVDTYVDE
jgi:nitrite reductase (NADH) large subunit